MSQAAAIFLLLLGGVLLTPVAERLRVPAPALTTVFGLLVGLLPSLPDEVIPPHLLLPLVLPPLLYAAARRSSWREFAANVRPILVLAVVLVFVTAAVVAAVAATVHPLLPLAGAVVLGAIVSPPDAAAVTTIAGRLGLPRRLVTVLEGEGLFNDVTALTLYQVTVAGMVAGSFSLLGGAARFLYAAAVAVVVGLLVAVVAAFLFDRIADSQVTTALSLLVPYLAYVPADELHASGVLAVITAAFYLGARAVDPDDTEGRLTRASFWEVTELVVTAVTFGVIGMELVGVFRAVGPSAGSLLWKAVLIGLVVIGVRALWMVLAYALARTLRRWEGRELGWRSALVVAWSGMRGVVTIVTALALPYENADGEPLAYRDQMLFVAMVVVVLTLLLQGLSLPWLIGRVGLQADAVREAEARRKVLAVAEEAAFTRLNEVLAREDRPPDVGEKLRARYELLFAETAEGLGAERSEEREGALRRRARLRDTEREMLAAARAALVAARGSKGFDPVAVDEVMVRLDVRSAALG